MSHYFLPFWYRELRAVISPRVEAEPSQDIEIAYFQLTNDLGIVEREQKQEMMNTAVNWFT
jgi:hypothetical protein